MILQSTAHLNRKLKRLAKKNPLLTGKLDQIVRMLLKNPDHPSLRLHKLSGKSSNQWSLTVERDLRIIFQYTVEGILFTDIGSHDEVY